MKTILNTSLLLNVMLLVGMLLFWPHSRMVQKPAPAMPALTSEVEPQMPSTPVVQTVAAPFHWNQLLSNNNYLAFVANLRAAGCPEATVEDIVRGDTARAYTAMRARLGVGATDPGRWSQQAQAQMTAYFLGQAPNVPEATGIAQAPGPTENNQATDNTQTPGATLAAYLQTTDFTTPGMSDEQAQETANLRQTFLTQISAASPNNPAGASSTSGSGNASSSPTAVGNSQTGTDNLPAGTDNSQAGADSSQSVQSQTGNGRFQRSAATQALIQQAQQESMMAGLFGMGAAVQYDQYQSAQGQ